MKLTDVIRRPLVTEKTTLLREDGRTVVFVVARDGQQDRRQAGGREAARRQGRRRPHREHPGQAEAPGPVRRAALRLEEGVRHVEGRPEAAGLPGRGITDAYSQVQADFACPSPDDGADLRRHHDATGRTSRSPSRRRSSGGRNSTGEQTSWWRGGGHKRLYRIIDFKRDKRNIPATVVDDRVRPEPLGPDRARHLRRRREALHPAAARPQGGRHHRRRRLVDILPGNCLPLGHIPLGTMVHNVELKPGKGGQLARSAGAGVQVVAKEGEYVSVKMPSGEIRKIAMTCMATIGQVGQSRSRERVDRQGRPEPLARQAPARARRRDEPGRPPARRRRGQDLGRPSPGDAVGRADQGLQDPHPASERRVHRAAATEVSRIA